MWAVLEDYGVKGSLLGTIKAFYKNSRACVRVCRKKTDFFGVGVGLRQGCVMSPWLFNVFIDSVVKGMNRGGKGAVMVGPEGRWEVSVLLFDDDAVLVSDKRENLECLVAEFERMCREKKLKVNPGKSKVLCMEGKCMEENGAVNEWAGLQLEGESLEKVNVFRYLGMDIAAGGGINEEINHRIAEGMKALGGLREIWKRGKITRDVKVKMFECFCVPSLLYGCETWTMNAKVRKRVEVFEMKGLRSASGVRRIEKIRNTRIKEMCNWNKGLMNRVEQGILRWFGHVCRMNEERMVGKVFRSEVEGIRGRGRPKGRWMDEVRELVRHRGLNVEEGMRLAGRRDEWRRRVVYGGVRGGVSRT